MTGVFRRPHFAPYYKPPGFVPSAAAGAGTQTIALAAIDTLEAAGASALTASYTAQMAGVGAGEAFGAPTAVPGAVTLGAAAIASQESVGTANTAPVSLIILAGLPSAELHGAVGLSSFYTLAAQAIGSQESVGQTSVLAGAVSINLAGVVSAELLGPSVVAVGAQTLAPGAVPSDLAVGVLTVTPGAVTLLPAALPNAEAVSPPGISPSNIVFFEGGVPAGERLGQTLFIQGPAVVSVASLLSTETAGHIVIVGGAQTVGRLIAEIKSYAALNGTLDLRGPDATTRIN